SNIVASNGPLSGSSTVVGNLNNYNVLRNNMSNERKKVFIVHGHDSKLKLEVQSLLFREGFDPIILHDQTNNGDTIIEKLERYIEQVSFAIVLYTGCDIGRANYLPESGNKARARQNVVFEHGYLISKLSRKRVVALRAEGVEVPGDLDGLVYLDVPGWEYRLSKELESIR
ncbi:TPA: nucleotide-binding protein, partial [Serratia marcescens]|nr:nucleotide-binding protein [Serratia marcescens]HED3029587.1 nucleotide-binding protein [Serratia marcescens]HED3713452.1 nucleotide-binding protein [Serratia marcescens]HED3729648.1 nucleotide-binding protein [Serratia marcescens]HED3739777.1 nucleotide-binding protein [Serratia marcescens]